MHQKSFCFERFGDQTLDTKNLAPKELKQIYLIVNNEKVKILSVTPALSLKNRKIKKCKTILAGIEPAIFCSVGRRVIHCATGPEY